MGLRWLCSFALGTLLSALSTPACSSSNKNTQGSGGNSGTGGTASGACGDAGDSCAECCATEVGTLAETAFKDDTKQCVCESAPFFCTTACAELCTQDTVFGACVVCLRTEATSCLNSHCITPDCMNFRACLESCK
jgi:hypothetical protein